MANCPECDEKIVAIDCNRLRINGKTEGIEIYSCPVCNAILEFGERVT